MLSLHTDGRLIKDTIGRTVNLKGCQHPMFHASEPGWKPQANPQPFATRMKELGVNYVRISTHYGKWTDPTISSQYIALIDDFIAELTARNIYCMIGSMGHELVPELAVGDTTNWRNWLTELANRYASNPGMCGIYILNEPPYGQLGGMDGWYSLAAQGVDAVRNANPDLLIVTHADIFNRQGFYERFFTEPLGANAVLTYHYYYWMEYYYGPKDFTLQYEAGNYETAAQLMEDSLYDRFWRFAYDYDQAIICDEFGFNGGKSPSGNPGSEPGWPPCQIDYMEMLETYEVPFSEYSWWVKTDTNYGLAQEANYYSLSPVGEIWKLSLPPKSPFSLIKYSPFFIGAFLLARNRGG